MINKNPAQILDTYLFPGALADSKKKPSRIGKGVVFPQKCDGKSKLRCSRVGDGPSDTVTVTTSSGSSGSQAIIVPISPNGSTYSVTKQVPNDWELVSSSCKESDDSDIPTTSLEIESGEQWACTFTDRRMTSPSPPANIPLLGPLGFPILSGLLGGAGFSPHAGNGRPVRR